MRSKYPTSIGRRRRIRPNDAGHIGCGSDCVRHFNPEIDKRNEIRTKGRRKTRLTPQFIVSFPKICYLSARQTEAFMDEFIRPCREKGTKCFVTVKYFIAVHTEQGSRSQCPQRDRPVWLPR